MPPQPGSQVVALCICSISSTSPGLVPYRFPIPEMRRIPDEFPSVAQAHTAGSICGELNQVCLAPKPAFFDTVHRGPNIKRCPSLPTQQVKLSQWVLRRKRVLPSPVRVSSQEALEVTRQAPTCGQQVISARARSPARCVDVTLGRCLAQKLMHSRRSLTALASPRRSRRGWGSLEVADADGTRGP